MPQAGSYPQEPGFVLASTDQILVWSGGKFEWVSPQQMATSMYVLFAQSFPPTWTEVTTATYSIKPADVNSGLDVTVPSVLTIPSTLINQGTITIRKNFTGAGSVSLAAGSGVTLDLPGGRSQLVTQFQTMALISFNASNHWTLSGAEQ